MSENSIAKYNLYIPNFLRINKTNSCNQINMDNSLVKNNYIKKALKYLITFTIFGIIFVSLFAFGQREHPKTVDLIRISTALMQTGMIYIPYYILKKSLNTIKQDVKYMVDIFKIEDFKDNK